MKKLKTVLMGAVFAASIAGITSVAGFTGSAIAAGKTIAVSWKIFQEERWKRDEAVILRVFESPNILLTFCVGWILYWS